MILKVKWSVQDRDSYERVPEDCPPRCYPMSLVVLGQIRTTVRIGQLHLVLQIVATTSLFPCVDYRWWLVVRGARIELSKWVGTHEPTRLTTGLGRVGLKFFYKFQYRLIFYPAHLEPD